MSSDVRIGRLGIGLLAVAALVLGAERDGWADEPPIPAPPTAGEVTPPAGADTTSESAADPAPVPADVPSESAADPAPVPAAVPAATAGDPGARGSARPRRAGIFGLGFGVGSSTGPSGDVFGIGGGLDVTLGFKAHRVSIEIHTGVGYAAQAGLDQLRASKTRGHFVAHAAIIRLDLSPTRSVGFSVFGGAATASVPLLAVGTMGGRATAVAGNGLTLGGGVSYPLAKYVEIGIDVALYFIRWDLPGSPYASAVEAVDETHVRYTSSTEDVSAIPWRLTASLRVIAF